MNLLLLKRQDQDYLELINFLYINFHDLSCRHFLASEHVQKRVRLGRTTYKEVVAPALIYQTLSPS